MAKPPIRFTVAFAQGGYIICFRHPLHGAVAAVVEHDNRQLTRAAVVLGGVNAPISALGSYYAEAVIDMARWSLVRSAS